MANYNSISEIKSANRVWAKCNDRAYWFAGDAMKFFGTQLYSKVFHGCMFITSEQFLATEYGKEYLGMEDGDRLFTIRVCKDDGSIDTVGEFQQYDTYEDAEQVAQTIKVE